MDTGASWRTTGGPCSASLRLRQASSGRAPGVKSRRSRGDDLGVLNHQADLQKRLGLAREQLRLADRDIAILVTEARQLGRTDDWIAGTLGMRAASMRLRDGPRIQAKRLLKF